MPPPDTELVSRAEIQVDAPASAVYARLLDARRWNAWRTPPLSGRFLGAVTRYSDAVSEGDRLGVLASPSVAGVLPLPTRATVTRASGGVLSFDDDALFGLASGTTSIAVRSVGWGGKRCVVTAEHTTRGPLGFITPALAKERAMARWVLDLKGATEGK